VLVGVRHQLRPIAEAGLGEQVADVCLDRRLGDVPPLGDLRILVIGSRMLFAYGTDHWFTAAVTTFSIENRITGADGWTAAFVLMALAMVLVRVLAGAIQTMSVPRVPAAVTA
jgi:hypothetical protein